MGSNVAAMADGAINGMLFGAVTGATEAEAIEVIVLWLLTPLSGSSEHFITTSIAWHGRLMVLGMGILTPPIIIVARFFKVTPRQNWPRELDNPFLVCDSSALGLHYRVDCRCRACMRASN
jgi:hypothetical protein